METEKRLIDANELQQGKFCEPRTEWHQGWNDALDAAKEAAPTVDAVEVVRCKECRWARPQDYREPVCTPAEALICQCCMHYHIPAPWGARMEVKPDDFCSYGERK